MNIPELGVEVEGGTMGSVYSTVEGIIVKLHENLSEANPFGLGDSAESTKFKLFMQALLVVFAFSQP